MKNLFLLVAGAVVTILCTSCRAKDDPYSTLNTPWHHTKGELQLRQTILPITVYHRGALENETLKIVAPLKEGQFEVAVPAASIYSFTLPNHTTIWLNSGSRLLLDPSSTIMHLDGEALVRTTDAVATIYSGHHEFVHGEQGTYFNISNYSDYPSEHEIVTSLLEGTVVVNSRSFRDTLTHSGMTMILDKGSFEKTLIPSNPQEVISWTKEGLQYSDIQVKKLLHKIGRRYGMRINGEDNIDNYSINYNSIDSGPLQEKLKIISKQYPNCSYVVDANTLNVVDLTWVIQRSRTSYFRNCLK